MLSKNSGRTITKINKNKDNVSIFLLNGTKLIISYYASSQIYLYEGKVLKQTEIDDLEALTKIDSLLEYARRLLRKGHYSELRLEQKLYARKGTTALSVKKVIEVLKENDLINDYMLAQDLKEYYDSKNYSKINILIKLNHKGLLLKHAPRLSFPTFREIEKAAYHAKIIKDKYQDLSKKALKSRIYSSLYSKRFEYDVVEQVLVSIDEEEDIYFD